MSVDMTIRVHEVAVDGLPNMDDPNMTGRVAFIWDGCVISGWPISREAETDGHETDGYDGPQRWEPSEDRFGGPVAGVTHWVELPTPPWMIASRSGE